LKTTHVRGNEKKLYIILEGAMLETVKVSFTSPLNSGMSPLFILFTF
jgi:hypothetical protein